MWAIFKETTKSIQERCIPLRPIRKQSSIKPPWFDMEIRSQIKMKKLAHHESKRLGTERSINHSKEMRAKLKKLIKR